MIVAQSSHEDFKTLIEDVKSCTICKNLPLGPKPILQGDPRSRTPKPLIMLGVNKLIPVRQNRVTMTLFLYRLEQGRTAPAGRQIGG